MFLFFIALETLLVFTYFFLWERVAIFISLDSFLEEIKDIRFSIFKMKKYNENLELEIKSLKEHNKYLSEKNTILRKKLKEIE